MRKPCSFKAYLLNENHADVYFLVGIDDDKERLPAHKVVLANTSEVFRGQLSGNFEVPDTIVVDDTTPAAFKLLMSYIYTDEVELTPDNAFPVLYLARKYLLDDLVAKVSTYITTAYNDESVAKILPHLHLLGVEHAQRVWDAIDLNAEVILKSAEFLELSHAALCDILRRNLEADELTVFNSVVAWARAECQRKALAFATDASTSECFLPPSMWRKLSFATDARALVGNALKLIRFPLMSIEEFASGPAESSLLSDQEKRELYNWYGLRTGHEQATFSSTPRKRPVLSCIRFDLSSARRGDRTNTEAYKQRFFKFSVDARVRFHGIAFFGRRNESSAFVVAVSLLNASSGETLATTHATVKTDGSEDTYKVLFDQPVMIVPRTEYKIVATSFGPHSIYARGGRHEVTCKHGGRSATFAFTDTDIQVIEQYDLILMSHVPVIYFSFA